MILESDFVYSPLPYATLLIQARGRFIGFVNNNPIYGYETKSLATILREIKKLVICDSACTRSAWNNDDDASASRDGQDLGYFSAFNTQTSRWLYGSRRGGNAERVGVQWLCKTWAGGPGTWNPALPGVVYDELRFQQLFVEFCDGQTVIEYGGKTICKNVNAILVD